MGLWFRCCLQMCGPIIYMLTYLNIRSRRIHGNTCCDCECRVYDVYMLYRIEVYIHCVPKKWDSRNLEYLVQLYPVSLLQWNLACDILMTLTIKCIHDLPPHLSYVSTLPDITQKRKSYVVFLSVVWVALKRTSFGVFEVALSRLCG